MQHVSNSRYYSPQTRFSACILTTSRFMTSYHPWAANSSHLISFIPLLILYYKVPSLLPSKCVLNRFSPFQLDWHCLKSDCSNSVALRLYNNFLTGLSTTNFFSLIHISYRRYFMKGVFKTLQGSSLQPCNLIYCNG